MSDLSFQNQTIKENKTMNTAKDVHDVLSCGGRGVTPTALAIQLGKTPQEVNRALFALGWQKSLGDGFYVPFSPGRKFCFTKKISKGRHKGTEVIDTWKEALVLKHLVLFFEVMARLGL